MSTAEVVAAPYPTTAKLGGLLAHARSAKDPVRIAELERQLGVRRVYDSIVKNLAMHPPTAAERAFLFAAINEQ